MDRQLLLAKQEVTYGVDPTAAAVNTIWAEDVAFKMTGQRVAANPAKPGYGPVASHTFGEYCTVEFSVPLNGSGVAGTAPKWGPLMLACGWSETVVAVTSVTYALLTNTLLATSMTLKWRDGNRRVHLVTGWRGAVSFKLDAGGRPMLMFKGKGIHNDVTTAGAVLAQSDASFTGWVDADPVAYGTTTFTFAGVSGLGIRQLSFDQSDNVRFINVPEQIGVDLVGERKFSGRTKFTTPLPSTLNLETSWRNGTVQTFAMVHGATAGKIATLNGRSQVVEPDYSRENGDDVVSMGLEIVPSSLITDDDLALVLT